MEIYLMLEFFFLIKFIYFVRYVWKILAPSCFLTLAEQTWNTFKRCSGQYEAPGLWNTLYKWTFLTPIAFFSTVVLKTVKKESGWMFWLDGLINCEHRRTLTLQDFGTTVKKRLRDFPTRRKYRCNGRQSTMNAVMYTNGGPVGSFQGWHGCWI